MQFQVSELFNSDDTVVHAINAYKDKLLELYVILE